MVSTHLRVLQRFNEEIEQGASWPRPHCRICGEGYVAWQKPTVAQNAQSIEDMNEPGWEPDWIAGTVHVVGKCENLGCQQIVDEVGTFRVAYSIEGQGHEYQGSSYSEFYKFHYFNPPLVLLALRESVPE